MFVILKEDKSKTERYVKSVTYHVPKIDSNNGEVLYNEDREIIIVT